MEMQIFLLLLLLLFAVVVVGQNENCHEKQKKQTHEKRDRKSISLQKPEMDRNFSPVSQKTNLVFKLIESIEWNYF